MSVSLYRKYRPQSFSEVLGQDHIVAALSSSLKSGNISHAYLFAGSRGTGKTSIARIFARDIGATPSDIYEIDAASYRGINEMKELLSGISTLPFESKYKVYILDEVHMLTREAWNALLKSLEEPPAHVVFILATTELHKVLDTVKSRCQVFEFKKPSIEILSGQVQTVAKKEGVAVDEEAATIIAKRGDGAFRDTLGLLERVMQSSDSKKITSADVEKILRTPQHELVTDFLVAVVTKNIEGALSIVHKVEETGQGLDHFIEQVIQTSRLVLLYRFAPDFAASVAGDLSPDAREKIVAWSKEKNIIDSKFLIELITILGEMKKTSIPVIVVELAIMRILGNNEA